MTHEIQRESQLKVLHYIPVAYISYTMDLNQRTWRTANTPDTIKLCKRKPFPIQHLAVPVPVQPSNTFRRTDKEHWRQS